LVQNEDEYEVERIMKSKTIRQGRGHAKKYLVKWAGYARPTWEPAAALENTTALSEYEERSHEMLDSDEHTTAMTDTVTVT
jgi:hypothetical protein